MERSTIAVPSTAAEIRMVVITSLVIGFLAMDRLSTGYIGPYLVHDLNLSITELGSLYSVQALAVAISGVVIGRYSDRTGRRRSLLLALLLAAALCAAAMLLAEGYVQLLGVRLAMGLALGGMTPIIQSIVAAQSTPSRMGLNIGIQTLLMFLMSQMAGPLVLTGLAGSWGWRASYAVLAAPFLLLAAAVALYVRDGGAPTCMAGETSPQRDTGSGMQGRTIILCIVLSACFMLWLVIHSTFLPLYLVQERGLSPAGAGRTMSVLGIAGAVGGLFLPMISDRIGARAALMPAMGLALLLPLAVLFCPGPFWLFQILLFVSWLSVGGLPIYAVIIPGSSVAPHQLAGAIALITGAGEVIGGIGGPLLAGQLADRFGLQALFLFTTGAALCCLCCAFAIGRMSR